MKEIIRKKKGLCIVCENIENKVVAGNLRVC